MKPKHQYPKTQGEKIETFQKHIHGKMVRNKEA